MARTLLSICVGKRPGEAGDNRGVGGRPDFQIMSTLSPIPSDQILASAVVAGRPWDRGRIVRMEAKAGIGGHGDRRRGQGLLG
jgi:hypothetical protein